jgi:phosphoglycolate phosphatase
MTPIRGILFDKDGTLIDFEASWSAIARTMALEAAGGDTAKADRLLDLAGFDSKSGRFRADSVFAAGTNEQVVRLWHPETPDEEIADMAARYDTIVAEAAAGAAVPLSGIPEAVAELHHRGFRLGVATNDSTAGAERTLEALGIAGHFAACFGYDAVENPKPAPDVVHAFAAKIGLEPAEIAFVGDNGHDLVAGREASCGLVIGVLSGTGTHGTLAPLAHVILNSVADLPAWLNKREGGR